MMLLWLILSIMAGGLLAWSVNQWSSFASRLVALLGVFVPFIVSTAYWTSLGFPLDTGADSS